MNRKLSSIAVILLCILLIACKGNEDIPSYNCEGALLKVTIGNVTSALAVNNNTLFRTEEDDGGYKLLTMGAISDSLKIVLNLKSGPYTINGLVNDSIVMDTFLYSTAGKKDGLVALGIRHNMDGFTFPTTDTSAIILTHVNYSQQTISGNYYFEADNHTITGQGTFRNVCYLSLP